MILEINIFFFVVLHIIINTIVASPDRAARPEQYDSYNCGVCKNDLVKNHKVALLCDACNKWYCIKCMRVSENIFDALTDPLFKDLNILTIDKLVVHRIGIAMYKINNVFFSFLIMNYI